MAGTPALRRCVEGRGQTVFGLNLSSVRTPLVGYTETIACFVTTAARKLGISIVVPEEEPPARPGESSSCRHLMRKAGPRIRQRTVLGT